MSSRNDILRAVRNSLPEPKEAPLLPDHEGSIEAPLTERFRSAVEAAGGLLLPAADRTEAIGTILDRFRPRTFWSSVRGVDHPENLAFSDPGRDDLAKLDLALLEASFGVAENGAVWISEKSMGQRIVPYITRNLAVILPAEKLVENLHLAYRRLHDREDPFGCFICGPSKTADIEQSLVMGAHGPETFTLLLTGPTALKQSPPQPL